MLLGYQVVTEYSQVFEKKKFISQLYNSYTHHDGIQKGVIDITRIRDIYS